MVREVDYPGILLVIVPAKKIVFRFRDHVGGGYGNVLVPGDVDPFSVIDTVIKIASNRKR